MRIFYDLWKINTIKLIVTTVSIFLTLKFLLPFFGPFVLAFLFVFLFRKTFARLERKLHIPWGIQAGVLLIVFAAVILLFVAVLTDQCIAFIGYCNQNGRYMEQCCDHMLTDCCRCMQIYFGWNAALMEEMVLEGASAMWEETYPKLMDVSYSYLEVCGAGIAFVTFTVIAILLTAKDYSNIRKKLRNSKFYGKLIEVTERIFKLLKVYLRAQGIIMLCISLVSVSGMFACGIPYAVALGVLAGVLDVLPFIGTGVVYVPVILLQLLDGHIWSAIGCAALYTICVFIRQILEPRLIGERINIYPVCILLSVFLGLRFYGIAGIFLGPLSLFLIKEIYTKLREEGKAESESEE